MAYLGQSPFGQTVRTTTSVVATAGQTTVYPTGGYTIGYIDVWVNGAKLTENTDFTANDGLSVVFSPALDVDDQVECISYGAFSFVDGVRRSGDSMSGTLTTLDVLPAANNTYNLGSDTARFNDIYLSNSSIYLGDLILSSNATNILLSNSSGLIGTMATGGGVNTFVYTAANATVDLTTSNGSTYSVTLNTGNNSTAGLLKIVDSTSNTSATIAASALATKTAYDTAVTAQNMAANAYSNAATLATTLAATAYTNATSYADTKAATAYSNATTYASNATNLSSGTVAFLRLPSIYLGTTAVQSTSAAQALSGITTLAAGNTTITGFANVTSTLQVNGAVTFANTLSVSGNITGSAANVTIVAGAFTTTFANNGTTSLPGNTTITGSANVSGTLYVGGVTTIAGNLVVNGTTITVNTSQINTTDSLIYLASNNEVTDSLDIGFAGHYNNGAGANGHTGFIRSAVDKKYYLFQNYQPEFFANNNVEVSNTATGIQMADLVVGNLVANSTLTVTGATTLNLTLAAGNTTITGFANVSGAIRGGSTLQISGAASGITTLATGNTTVTGFINVSTSVAAANINTSGTVSADIITVSNVAQTQTNLEVDPAGTAFLNALIYG